MNNSSKILSLILVTGVAGLAGLGLANSEFAARLPLESLLAATASVALLRVAFSDYARRPRTLTPPAALLRPAPRHVTPRFARHHLAA